MRRSDIVESREMNSEMSAVIKAYTFLRSAAQSGASPAAQRRRTATMVLTPPSCQSPSQ